jgi:hypothetical protein
MRLYPGMRLLCQQCEQAWVEVKEPVESGDIIRASTFTNLAGPPFVSGQSIECGFCRYKYPFAAPLRVDWDAWIGVDMAIKCECGAQSIGCATHSHWCPCAEAT